jgi:ABC-type transporter Mla subunit MlaD
VSAQTVDVLRIMDGARRTIAAQSKLSDDVMAHIADDVAQARVAIAELIDRDREYDAALANLSDLNRRIAENGWIEVEHDALRKASDRVARASNFRRVALARIGGAA